MQRLRGSPSIVVLLFYIACRLASVLALCPARCKCNDELLQVQCDSGNLDVVPITLNPDLRELYLRNNHIKSLLASFSVYHSLEYLDMSHNQLVTLGQRNFLFQKELKVLLSNSNMISVLENQTFQGLSSLQVLHLNENFLSDVPDGVFSHLAKLEKLDLSRNRLSAISPGAFLGLQNLRTLLLRDNKLEHISNDAFPNVPNLLCLDLGLNYFQDVKDRPFLSLSEMEELFLDGCGIRDFSPDAFQGLQSLIKLKIHDNELSQMPRHAFKEVYRLEELFIGQNLFKELGPASFPDLKFLKTIVINGAKYFNHLHASAFSENPNLERIVLNHNPQLRQMDVGAFASLPNLRYVSLRANGFSTIEHSLLPWDELEMLDIRDNPLVCNCSLLWLKQFLASSNSSNHAETVGALCSEPNSLAGTPLLDVSIAELNCDGDTARRQIIIGGVVAGAVAVAALLMIAFKFRERFSRTLKSKWTSSRKEPQYQKTCSGEDENAMLPAVLSHHCVKINPMTEL